MWAALAIVIHVGLSFDSTIHSKIVTTGAATEAAAIWHEYGVDLDWNGRASAAMCVSAFVARSESPTAADRPVLGYTFVAADVSRSPAPIRIGFDAVDALAQPSAALNAMLHEYAVGTAIGRVLAHEIGHILLGAPTYHDDTGLMRPQFASSDFARGERWMFRLADPSVARLRASVASLTRAPIAPGCQGM